MQTQVKTEWQEFKEALRTACEDSPAGERERAEIKDAVLGFVAVVIVIALLCIYFKYYADLFSIWQQGV